MHKLLYVSSTKRNLAEEDLSAILVSARANNSRLSVTGLLLYIDGGFLQVLEGEQAVIRGLYEKIKADTRHWDARLLLDEHSPRNFTKWNMGFKRLDHQADPGLVSTTRDAVAGLIQPGSARPVLEVLLRTFQRVQGGE